MLRNLSTTRFNKLLLSGDRQFCLRSASTFSSSSETRSGWLVSSLGRLRDTKGLVTSGNFTRNGYASVCIGKKQYLVRAMITGYLSEVPQKSRVVPVTLWRALFFLVLSGLMVALIVNL